MSLCPITCFAFFSSRRFVLAVGLRTGVCTDLKSGGKEYVLDCMVMSCGGKI